MNEWMNGMSRQVDGSRSTADPGSAQEYQDKEFNDEVSVSDPSHPLFPTCLLSKTAADHMCGAAKIGRQEGAAGWISTSDA